VKILKREATNTGPHDPVSATLRCEIIDAQTNKSDSTSAQCKRKINWSKLDVPKYKSLTQVKLTAIMMNIDSLPADIVVARINTVLKECAESCIEVRKPRKKKKSVLMQSFKPLAKNAKNAHCEYA